MRIYAKFSEINQTIKANFGETQAVTEIVGGEPYDGKYSVTPRVTEQTLPTKHKVMTDNMTIREIPFFNVSNTSGGSTAYIGSEV